MSFNPRVKGAENNYTSAALEAGAQVATQACYMYHLTVFNTNPGAQYIQLHDSATAPIAGAVPKIVFKIRGDDDRYDDYVTGRSFGLGVYVCNSSTPDTYTAGAADCLFDAGYTKRA